MSFAIGWQHTQQCSLDNAFFFGGILGSERSVASPFTDTATTLARAFVIGMRMHRARIDTELSVASFVAVLGKLPA